MWHFYGGDSLIVVEITKGGSLKETLLNKDNPQYVVSKNTWFGAYLPDHSQYALCGCTVAPAFHFSKFEMGNKEELINSYPSLEMIITKLMK